MFSLLSKKRVSKYTNEAKAYILDTYVEPKPPHKQLEKPQTAHEVDKQDNWLSLFEYDDDIRYSLPESPPGKWDSSKDDDVQYSLSEDFIEPTDSSQDSGIKYSISTSHRRKSDTPKVREARYSLPEDLSNTSHKESDQGVLYSLSRQDDIEDVNVAMRSMLQTGDYEDINPLLDKAIEQTFVEQIIEVIRDKGLRDSRVYKAAQIDRRLFSKIMSDLHYKPSKDTALALSYALELTIDQAKELLSKAGYSLSHSDKRDLIMEFFFKEKFYNITEINCVLENLGQKIIGR